MQGLSDGYFVIPNTIGNYLAGTKLEQVNTGHTAFKEAAQDIRDLNDKLLAIKGNKTVREFHRDIGEVLWNNVGMSRNETDLKKALEEIPKIREEFWQNVNVAGKGDSLNKNLEMAGRVADYLELAELITHDALHRKESCGGHFREESQTEEGEALRDDDTYCYAAAWEFKGIGQSPELHKEPLKFENVTLTQRSYK
jgi:succinate dehydrogenase / fumarate reductase flavoprotein subunit